jgi:hypothetical protein
LFLGYFVGDEYEKEDRNKNADLYHFCLDLISFSIDLDYSYTVVRTVTEVASNPAHKPWGQDFGKLQQYKVVGHKVKDLGNVE